jgi:hypothetical protein
MMRELDERSNSNNTTHLSFKFSNRINRGERKDKEGTPQETPWGICRRRRTTNKALICRTVANIRKNRECGRGEDRNKREIVLSAGEFHPQARPADREDRGGQGCPAEGPGRSPEGPGGDGGHGRHVWHRRTHRQRHQETVEGCCWHTWRGSWCQGHRNVCVRWKLGH